MEDINAVFEELNYPSAARLLQTLRKRGIPHDPKEVRALVAAETTRQVQAPNPALVGKIAARELNSLWFADLIDYTATPSKAGEKYVLVVQDVFSRYIWAEVLSDKTPQTVARAFEAILDDAGVQPKKLTTDKGQEFRGEFGRLVTSREIEHVVKTSQRQIATLDNAIRTLKNALARVVRRSRTNNWAGYVARVVEGYNKTPNMGEYLDGTAPQDVPGDEEIMDELEEKNREYIAHNLNNVEQRAEKLAAAGHFRVLKNKPKTFARAWQPRWSDEVYEVAYTHFDRVFDIEGNSHLTKFVLPVTNYTAEGSKPSKLERGGSAQVAARIQRLLGAYAQDVVQHFGVGRDVALSQVGTYLRSRVGFGAALTQARVNQKAPIAAMLRAFPEMFTVISPSQVRIRAPVMQGAHRLRRILA